MRQVKSKKWSLLIASVTAVVLVGQSAIASSQSSMGCQSLPSSMGSQSVRWQLIGPPGGEVLDIDVDPNDSRRLYAATRSGVYRSTDGGSSWSLVLDGLSSDLVIDPQNSDVIYTGPRDSSYRYGVHKSTDGGDSWTHYDEGMTCTNLATLAIAASNPSILFTGSF